MSFSNRILPAVGLVLLGAALAVVVQRLVIAGGDGGAADAERARRERAAFYQDRLALAEERCREEAELRLGQLLRLVEIERFAQRGLDVSLVLVASRTSSIDRGLRLPEILFDAEARSEWSELRRSVAGFEGSVDPRVFDAFRDVREFLDGHPLPDRGGLVAISQTAWGRAEVVERWLTLNESLSSRVAAALGQFYTTS